MILGATHDNGRAVELIEDSSDIVMQFVPQHSVAQKGPAFFGGEDGMQKDFR